MDPWACGSVGLGAATVILLISLALSETAAPYAGSASLESSDVPGALTCVDVQLSEEAPIDQPFEMVIANSCAFTVEGREPGCVEDPVTSDFDGCARLQVAPGQANIEGLTAKGGDRDDVVLQWFDPASPEVLASGTWGLGVLFGSGGNDSDDSDVWQDTAPEASDSEPHDSDEAVAPDAQPDARCGCATETSPPWWLAVVAVFAFRR